MIVRRLVNQAWSWFRRRAFCARGKHHPQRWNVGLIAGWQCANCTVMATVVEIIEKVVDRKSE